MSDSSGDIVERLRAWRDERGFPTPGEMMDEAIAEISRLRLTDAEREAIKRLGPSADPLASFTVTLTPNERTVFHGLLERLW